MTELKVSLQESGQRLNKFLMKYLNQAPSSFIYKMLRKKNITVNDIKARGDEIIKTNDTIKLFLSDETIAKFREKRDVTAGISAMESFAEPIVLYTDENIIAVHKPDGILSQKAREDDLSINEIIVSYCYRNNMIVNNGNTSFIPSICNRLDRNTSGIILAGKTLYGSQMLSKLLKQHDCDKYYSTIVKGVFKDSLRLDAYIKKDTAANISRVISKENYLSLSDSEKAGYSPIASVFYRISGNESFTLIKIKLITGKSHQIRAGLKHLGFPVIGDGKYGNTDTNRYFRDRYGLKHHLLHCFKISFNNITITDPLPEIFEKICSGEKINMNFDM